MKDSENARISLNQEDHTREPGIHTVNPAFMNSNLLFRGILVITNGTMIQNVVRCTGSGSGDRTIKRNIEKATPTNIPDRFHPSGRVGRNNTSDTIDRLVRKAS